MGEMFGFIVESIPSFVDALFTLEMLIALTVGIFGGLLIGALPGLNSVIGVSLLLPVTYGMTPIPAISMLMALFTTSILGGSFTAVLVHTPGTAASAATLLDGYAMTRKGEALRALNMCIFASTFGGVFSALMLMFVSPFLARLSLTFDSAEYFWVGLFGISIIASLSDSGIAKGFSMGCLGMLLSTVGIAPISGNLRYTYGMVDLSNGFRSVVVMLGLFSISQVIRLYRETWFDDGSNQMSREVNELKGRKFLSREDIALGLPHIVRSSLIGTWVGILPGAGANIAAFIAYNEGKKRAKYPAEYGKGSIEGVAAPEAANNAVSGSSVIPLLTLGIPGSPTAAVLLGGLMIHGLIPGANLFTKQANITYPIIFIFLLSNLLMLPIGMWFARIMKYVVRIERPILNTVVAVFVVLGAFSVAGRPFDLFVILIFGFVGYLAKEANYSEPGFVLGLILGFMTEEGFMRASVIAKALDMTLPEYFFSRPMCIGLIMLLALSIGGSVVSRLRQRKSPAVPADI